MAVKLILQEEITSLWRLTALAGFWWVCSTFSDPVTSINKDSMLFFQMELEQSTTLSRTVYTYVNYHLPNIFLLSKYAILSCSQLRRRFWKIAMQINERIKCSR